MSKHNTPTESTTKKVFETLNKSVFSVEQFLEQHSKKIIICFVALLIMVSSWYIYKIYYVAPLDQQANNEIFYPMDYFQKGEYKLALEGDGQQDGFLDLLDKYSLSNMKNILAYYSALSYEALQDFDNAMVFLEKISVTDNDFNALVYSKKGDIYSQKNSLKEALSYYEKAVSESGYNYPKSMYLYKAALLAFELKEFSISEKYFQNYVDNYPLETFSTKASLYLKRLAWSKKNL